MTSLFKTISLFCLLAICILNFSCTQASGQTNATISAKFKEYKVIVQYVSSWSPNTDDNFKPFESKVNAALNEGWTPIGGVTEIQGVISQAVAK
jgi:hypothetical protein